MERELVLKIVAYLIRRRAAGQDLALEIVAYLIRRRASAGKVGALEKELMLFVIFPISEHLFEYIGTQFPQPSAVLYGKMSSITLVFFSSKEYNRHDTTIYALDIYRHFTFYSIKKS